MPASAFVMLLCAAALSIQVAGIMSVQRIEECLRDAAGPPPKQSKERAGRQLFLYFGDAGIEAVSVMKEYDIKRVNSLAKCVAMEDSSLFEDRTNYIESFHDGGSNVTYLTGIFQKLLPDIERSIRTIAQKAIAQADWSGDISKLGVRSVQHLSFYKPGIKAYRQEKKLQQLKKDESQPAFVIHPSHESVADRAKKAEIQKRMQVDPDADEVVSGYLQQWEPAGAVAFSAVIALSDRSQFVGGEVLVSRVSRQRTTIRPGAQRGQTKPDGAGEEESDDAADEQDEETDEDVYSDVEQERRRAAEEDEEQADPGVPQYPRFSAETTTISRYTPELGSMLLGLGEYSRGLRPVLFGRRNSLVLEYWAYEDAPAGTKRPSLQEARPRHLESSVQGEL